jgi:type II secretory pathway predicted ATPase ExeA
MLHPHRGHAEAVARITWLVAEHAIGVVTGEVGAGKTAGARAAVAKLDPVRHTIVYLPNPCIGQRGCTPRSSERSAATPASTKPRWSPRPPSS